MVQTKALYNHLRFVGQEAESGDIEPWMIEDLRLVPVDDIFLRLGNFGIKLDRKSFIRFAEECESPDSLADLLVDEEKEPPEYDQIYLLLFELWRRFLPERTSLSIFCDELDYQIDKFYKDELESDEPIQDGLANLSEILEEHIDAKVKPKDAFALISEYCATNLEIFLYDFISDLLDQENELYAQELLDEYGIYFPKDPSFEFLKARVTSLSDPFEANRKVEAILSKKPNIELLFAILQFLVTSGEHPLFQAAIKQLLPQLSTDEEFREVLDLSADYYHRLDKDELEAAILRIGQQRKSSNLELKQSDPDLRKLEAILLK